MDDSFSFGALCFCRPDAAAGTDYKQLACINLKQYNIMKKLFLVMGVIALMASLNSCTKTCTCKSYVNGELVGTTTAEAKGNCSKLDVKQEVMGMTNETKCENE